MKVILTPPPLKENFHHFHLLYHITVCFLLSHHLLAEFKNTESRAVTNYRHHHQHFIKEIIEILQITKILSPASKDIRTTTSMSLVSEIFRVTEENSFKV